MAHVASALDEEWILGFGGSAHDFSAALMHGTDIRVAIESERVTRVKYGVPNWFEDPLKACASYCLETEGIERANISRYVAHDFLPPRVFDAWPVKTFNHHLCHAASAVMMLAPETRACVIVYDGAGSGLLPDPVEERPRVVCETFSFYEFSEGHLDLIGRTTGQEYLQRAGFDDRTTNSMGELYELVSTLLGFGFLEVGKTMGLAGWGVPRFLDDLLEVTSFGNSVDDVFRCDLADESLHGGLRRRLEEERYSPLVRADLAASVQELMNRCLAHCYGLISERDFDVLCLAGGCALNTVANGMLAKMLPHGRRLLVPPHAGDAGLALGSLWLEARERIDDRFALKIRGRPLAPHIARPGRCYTRSLANKAMTAAAAAVGLDSATGGAADLARRLANGEIIAVFDGASEIGPRALGGRSILADPRQANIREVLNRTIKHREPFRPLAPIVLSEHFDEYFTPATAANEFMLVIADATELCKRAAPSTVHVDGTARVQVVPADESIFVRRVLASFHDLTGVPVLLNTSFNRRGEPIVETPDQAVAAFLDMGLDGMWLDGLYIFVPPADHTPVAAG